METDAPHITVLSRSKQQTFVSLSAHIARLAFANNLGRGCKVQRGRMRFKLCWVDWRREGVGGQGGVVFKELAPRPYGGGALEWTAQMNILSSPNTNKTVSSCGGKEFPPARRRWHVRGLNVQRLLPSRRLWSAPRGSQLSSSVHNCKRTKAEP